MSRRREEEVQTQLRKLQSLQEEKETDYQLKRRQHAEKEEELTQRKPISYVKLKRQESEDFTIYGNLK